jgi:hypothetical protein
MILLEIIHFFFKKKNSNYLRLKFILPLNEYNKLILS